MSNAAITILIVLTSVCIASGQPLLYHGKVVCSETGNGIPMVHILVEGTDRGTVADDAGAFRIALDSANSPLRFSAIGYRSARIVANRSPVPATIALEAVVYQTGEVSVTPDDSLARWIIEQAIRRKQETSTRLRNYQVEANTRAQSILDSVTGISSNSERQSLRRRLSQVGETRSIGRWTAPDRYQETIVARRNTSRLPIENTISSIPLRSNFSDDDIQFGQSRIIGPVSFSGLGNYYYSYAGVTQRNSSKVHLIRVLPRSRYSSCLSGVIAIEDSTFFLVEVDVKFQFPVTPMYIDSVLVHQSFRKIAGEFYLPASARVRAFAQLPAMMSTVHIRLIVDAVMEQYSVNIEDGHYGRSDYRVIVSESADNVDEEYWEENGLLPRSKAELEAYSLDDSLRTAQRSRLMSIGLTDFLVGRRIDAGRYSVALPGILTALHYNRIEGLGLGVPLVGRNVFGLRETTYLGLFYGISDKQIKLRNDIAIPFRCGGEDLVRIRVFNDLAYIDSRQMRLRLIDTLLTSVASAVYGKDPRDYFYRSGVAGIVEANLFPQVRLKLNASYQSHNWANVQSSWRLLSDSPAPRDNSPVTDGIIASFSGRLSYDHRQRSLIMNVIRRQGDERLVPNVGVSHNRYSGNAGTWAWTDVMMSAGMHLNLGFFGDICVLGEAYFADNRLPIQSLQFPRSSMVGLTETHSDSDRSVRASSLVTDRYRYSWKTH